MTTGRKAISRLCEEQDGAAVIEYGLLATLIAVAIIVGASSLRAQVLATYQDIRDAIAAAPNP